MSFFSVDMRVLRSFISVVETGSISETARRLGRTQPAITLQMKRLEDLSQVETVDYLPGVPMVDLKTGPVQLPTTATKLAATEAPEAASARE